MTSRTRRSGEFPVSIENEYRNIQARLTRADDLHPPFLTDYSGISLANSVQKMIISQPIPHHDQIYP